MKVSVLAAGSLAMPAGGQDIPRPTRVEAGGWRRFSRLARLGACALSPVLESAPDACRSAGVDFDRDELALFFGTGIGEFLSSYSFLKSLFTKGPAMASPLAFQNSVHNAAPGHLSMAFGLRGPSETLCAGPLTVLRTFERAMVHVVAHEQAAIVLLADDLGADSELGWRLAGVDAPLAEGAAAFLIAPARSGSTVLSLVEARGDEALRSPLWPGEVEGARTIGCAEGLYSTAEAHLLAQAFARSEGLRIGFRGERTALDLQALP